MCAFCMSLCSPRGRDLLWLLRQTSCAGLQNDCPFRPGANGRSRLTEDEAETVEPELFEAYTTRLNAYLQVRESWLSLECCRLTCQLLRVVGGRVAVLEC